MINLGRRPPSTPIVSAYEKIKNILNMEGFCSHAGRPHTSRGRRGDPGAPLAAAAAALAAPGLRLTHTARLQPAHGAHAA